METARARSLPAEAVSAPVPAAEPGPAALADVVSAVRPEIYRIARRCLGPDDAEDITQETLLRALGHQDEVRLPGLLWPWVRQIAINESMRRQRALAIAPPSVALPAEDACEDEALVALMAPDPQDVVLARLQAEELHRAIARLTECQRSAIRLHYLEGMPLADVGVREGITARAAKKRLADARAALFRLLGPAFPERWQ